MEAKGRWPRLGVDEAPLSSCSGGCSCCVRQYQGVQPGSLWQEWGFESQGILLERGWETGSENSVIWCEMPMQCISLEQAGWEPPFVKPWNEAQHWFACFVFPLRFLNGVMLFQPPSARALKLSPPREVEEEVRMFSSLDRLFFLA